MIKAVIFDIDGVLLDSFKANLKFFQDLMVQAGYHSPTKKEYLPLFHKSMLDVIKILTKSSSDEEINRVWEMGRVIKYQIYLLKVPKGVEETIKKLSKEYVLGIVTNRVREGIYKIPTLSKLQKYFQVTISYQDTINHKPHPEPLLLACQKLNIVPKETVYIGDAESDIVAGKAAGMKVILYSKNQLDNADFNTSSFTKLPELIKKFEQYNRF